MLHPVPEDGRFDLETLGFDCTLDAIYEDVRFAPAADQPPATGTIEPDSLS